MPAYAVPPPPRPTGSLTVVSRQDVALCLACLLGTILGLTLALAVVCP